MLFLKLKCNVYKTYYNQKFDVNHLEFGIPAPIYLGEIPKNLDTKTLKIFSFPPYNNVDIEEDLVIIGNNKEIVVKTKKDLPVWTKIQYRFLVNPNCSSKHYHISFDLIQILNENEYKQIKNI